MNFSIIENRTDFVIRPGWILPELSFEALRDRLGYVAERKLIIAVLEDAVMCYQKYMCEKNAQDRRTFDQAEAWLMRRERRGGKSEGFSFEFICDSLGLDAETLREELRKWRDQARVVEKPFVSSRQRCRWRAVYREPYRGLDDDAFDELMAS